jgi:hypothetical protein
MVVIRIRRKRDWPGSVPRYAPRDGAGVGRGRSPSSATDPFGVEKSGVSRRSA